MLRRRHVSHGIAVVLSSPGVMSPSVIVAGLVARRGNPTATISGRRPELGTHGVDGAKLPDGNPWPGPGAFAPTSGLC
jgi:hypothetical protein